MGSWFSSSKTNDQHKDLKSNGEIINNITIDDPVKVHDTDTIVILLCVLCALKLLSLIIYTYNTHKKYMKKKYGTRPT